MSTKREDEVMQGIGAVAVVLFAVLIIVHAFVFSPFIVSRIYNWYLMDFLHTDRMTWHNAYGISLLLSFWNYSIAKKSVEGDTKAVCTNMFNVVLFMWMTYFFAWLLQDLAMWG